MIELSLVWMVLPTFWTFGINKVEVQTPESDMWANCYTFRLGIIGFDVCIYGPTD